MAMTHGRQYGEEYYSFVNGQHTTQGGTHLSAFREAVAKTIRDFYKKDFDISDIRTSIIGAISIKVQEPVFESQTKTKLGSKDIGPHGPTVRNFIMDFVNKELDNYLHRNPDTAELLLRKIVETEKERKAMSGVQKIARERAKQVSLHNRKLREERENKRPIITDTKQEIALWNIWVYYQKDIMRRLAQQKNAGGGVSDDE